MKYALVTGSTRGIGAAIAGKLIQNEYRVFCNGRGNSDRENYIQADLSKLDGVNLLADRVLASAQTLDCLVLNAGMTCRKPLREIEPADWQTVMDTNVNMPFFLVQRLFNNIAENGSVVFISSVLSLKPHSISIPYGVSKAAVNMLAQNLVKEFAPRGVRVNVICPGFIDTLWQREKPEELRAKIERKTALRRFGTPEEVADMCWGVISNTYINGAVIAVDGGYDME